MAQLAWIIPIAEGSPTPPIFYPPQVLPPMFPTNPIAPGGPPPGIWPSPPVGIWPNPPGPFPTPPIFNPPVFPMPPIFNPPYPSTGPGFPTPPIYFPPPQPPSIWNPVFPTHPISPGGPSAPPGIWQPAFPTNPIAPGGGPSFKPPDDSGEWILVWVPGYGYHWFNPGPPATKPIPMPEPK